MKRISKSYKGSGNGNRPTSRHLRDLLPDVMAQISGKVDEKPRQVIEAWSDLVGPEISKMARAVSFEAGVLKVNVENSTLYTLMTLHERKKLLASLRRRLPKVAFRTILFRIG